MGLSASQARLLNLTSRMHDIEYKAQNLESQKLQMSNESTQVYKAYEDALNKQKVQLKKIDTDGSAKYEDATLADLFTAGYHLSLFGKDNNWHDVTSTSELSGLAATTGLNSLSTSSKDVLSNLVQAGYIVFQKQESSTSTKYIDTNIATDTNLQEVTDETDLKKAEAKYEADMRKIDAKDKKFDTDLAAMETERNAIKTEIDTLKTVAKDNVDRTFKLFS